jgi:chemotaxis protein CheC
MNLSSEQIDALQEVVNIGVGYAASLLNDMVTSPIALQVPVVKVLFAPDAAIMLGKEIDSNKLTAVRLGFQGFLNGKAELIFPAKSASLLVATVTGEDLDSPDLDALKIGTLTEIGNIVINSIIGSISNLLNYQLTYSLLVYLEGNLKEILGFNGYTNLGTWMIAQACFKIAKMDITGNMILIFEVGSFDLLLEALEQL